MNEEFLKRFRQAPRREFSAALYQRLIQPRNLDPMKTRSRMLLRVGAAALTLIAVMAAVLFFSEPTRALADAVIRQFGGFIFVQGTATPDPKKQALLNEKAVDKSGAMTAETPGPKKQVPPDEMPADKASAIATEMAGAPDQNRKESGAGQSTTAPDAASASRLVGFTVLAPGYIPAGYNPSAAKNPGGNWVIEPARKGAIAVLAYENQSAEGFLSIQETRYVEGQPRQTYAMPEIVDVTVRGHSGVWMPVEDGKKVLVWEEGGVTFSVVSNILPLDELKKVAESLR